MTGSLRSCVCVTLWATTKARPFSCCRITVGEKKRGGAWWRRGDFRERGRKKGGLAFETGPAQMYRAGGLGCGCWWRSPGSTLPPSWPFVAPSSLGMVSCLPACQRCSMCARQWWNEPSHHHHHHHQTHPSLPTATPHTEDVMGELMPATVRLCVLMVDEQPVHTLTLWGP